MPNPIDQEDIPRNYPDVLRTNKFPDEILTNIFRQFVLGNGSPWNISFVSWRWYSVSVGDSFLWTRIMIKDRRPINCQKYGVSGTREVLFTEGNHQLCINDKELRIALNRSKNLPFEIRLQLGSAMPEIKRIVQRLFTTPISSRIGSLHISFWDDRMTSPLSEGFIPGALSSLRSLSIDGKDSTWPEWILSAANDTSPLLEEAIFQIAARSSVEYPALLGRLRRLTLPKRTLDLELFNRIIAKTPRLRELEGIPWGWPDNAFTLANVESIQLGCSSSQLSLLVLPKLRSLSLNQAHDNTASSWTEFHFLHLTSLDLTTESMHWLTYLNAPGLTNLTLIVHSAKPHNDYDDDDDGLQAYGAPLLVNSVERRYGAQMLQRRDSPLPMVEQTGYLSKYISHSILASLKSLFLEAPCSEKELFHDLGVMPNLRSLHFALKRVGEQQPGLELLHHLSEADALLSAPYSQKLLLAAKSAHCTYPIPELKGV